MADEKRLNVKKTNSEPSSTDPISQRSLENLGAKKPNTGELLQQRGIDTSKMSVDQIHRAVNTGQLGGQQLNTEELSLLRQHESQMRADDLIGARRAEAGIRTSPDQVNVHSGTPDGSNIQVTQRTTAEQFASKQASAGESGRIVQSDAGGRSTVLRVHSKSGTSGQARAFSDARPPAKTLKVSQGGKTVGADAIADTKTAAMKLKINQRASAAKANGTVSAGVSPSRMGKLNVVSKGAKAASVPGASAGTVRIGSAGPRIKTSATTGPVQAAARGISPVRARAGNFFNRVGASIRKVGAQVATHRTQIVAAGASIVIGVTGSSAALLGVLRDVAVVPAAAYVYEDLSEPTEEENLEIDTYIENGEYYLDDPDCENDKVLLTQAAVEAMTEEQTNLADKIEAGKDLNTWGDEASLWSVTVDGQTIPTSELDGIDYKDYKEAYTYIGYPDDVSVGYQDEAPDFVYPDDIPLSHKIRIEYHSGYGVLSGDLTTMVSYDKTETSGSQYLGDASFPRKYNGFHVVGWALASSSNVARFETYEQLDSETMERLVKYSKRSGRDAFDYLSLYAVWEPDATAAKGHTDTVKVLQESELDRLGTYFSEDDITVQYAYTSDTGQTEYADAKPTLESYQLDNLEKAILAMATVATDNDDKFGGRTGAKDVYVDYCVELMNLALTTQGGYRVDYTTKTMPGTRDTSDGYSWKEDGVTYKADGARLCAHVVIFVNSTADALMEEDYTIGEDLYRGCSFPGWNSDTRNVVYEYMAMDDATFIKYFRVQFREGSAMMIGGGPEATLFNRMVSEGYEPATALGLISALKTLGRMEEAWSDAANDKYGLGALSLTKTNQYAQAVEKVSWPTLSVIGQFGLMMQELETRFGATDDAILKTYTDAHDDPDYIVKSFEDFKTIVDPEQAASVFLAVYEGQAYVEPMMEEVIENIEAYMERVVHYYGVGTGEFIWPLPEPYNEAYITSWFGWRGDPFGGGGSQYHNGLDIGAPAGTPIYAVMSGEVVISADGWNGGCGNYTVVYHGNDLYTEYMHQSKRAVKVGQKVSQGETIGYVGTTGSSTGNHLHLGVVVSDHGFDYTCRTDPCPYLGLETQYKK